MIASPELLQAKNREDGGEIVRLRVVLGEDADDVGIRLYERDADLLRSLPGTVVCGCLHILGWIDAVHRFEGAQIIHAQMGEPVSLDRIASVLADDMEGIHIAVHVRAHAHPLRERRKQVRLDLDIISTVLHHWRKQPLRDVEVQVLGHGHIGDYVVSSAESVPQK